jgi:hypothetical protein
MDNNFFFRNSFFLTFKSLYLQNRTQISLVVFPVCTLPTNFILHIFFFSVMNTCPFSYFLSLSVSFSLSLVYNYFLKIILDMQKIWTFYKARVNGYESVVNLGTVCSTSSYLIESIKNL